MTLLININNNNGYTPPSLQMGGGCYSFVLGNDDHNDSYRHAPLVLNVSRGCFLILGNDNDNSYNGYQQPPTLVPNMSGGYNDRGTTTL